MVDKANKLRFGIPLPKKEAKGVANAVLDVVFTFNLPVSLRNDLGTKFIAEVVDHLCRWLNVSIDYVPVDHARAQGTAETLGRWLDEALNELFKT